ncbi:membrane-fusion protein [Brachyspira hyodysenteriae]|uniref:DUF2806 domain-containing protein n=1 Tax=Brachyspira hyodysenteriae TaxID=159 RepID=UPI001181DFF5|nr:DUF2806 domain-containing protein [Brachyspira hyodysenteriae]TVL67081.1 membrane-fusion protein [Brachyspira hyodysenteriae]TVL77081.1 membrane-fusion protein [Brachyspira hyodysenteriae]TVL86581.1 membrane-fusion protein [Brachyspira hyodysenteriae]
MDVNDIAGVGKAIEKLIDLLRGFGWKIHEPYHIKRIADAESYKRKLETDDKIYEIEKISEFITKNSNLNINHNNNGTEISNANILLENTKARLVNQELSRTSNIQNVISKTYDILKDEEDVSDKPVDKDWFTRYFNIVQDISNEDIQDLWAKLLAGEIKQPGSFSYRTLETLKNMTTDEAELFTKVAKLLFHICYKYNCLFKKFDLLSKYDIDYIDVVKLVEIGLIVPVEHAVLSFNKFMILFNDNYLFRAELEKENLNDIETIINNQNVLIVSRVGNEILKLIDNKYSNNEYFINNIKIIRDEIKGISNCKLNRIITNENSITFLEPNENLINDI